MCSKVALGSAAELPWPSKVPLETASKPPVHSKVLPRPAPEPANHAKAWPKPASQRKNLLDPALRSKVLPSLCSRLCLFCFCSSLSFCMCFICRHISFSLLLLCVPLEFVFVSVYLCGRFCFCLFCSVTLVEITFRNYDSKSQVRVCLDQTALHAPCMEFEGSHCVQKLS